MLKILLLVKRFIQISVDVNKPFVIKCCAMTQTEALLYYKYAVCGTNSPQINFFARIFSNVFSLWRRFSKTKKIKFHQYADIG